MKPENSYFTPHFFEEASVSKRGGAEVLRRCRLVIRRSDLRKTLSKAQAMLGRLAAAAFTTTVFLGGSYLFFIQLAEYGW